MSTPLNDATTAPWPARLSSAPTVLVLLALWLLATLGWRPLLLPDEGRYASVAREMLLGDGLVPTLNGLPFFHKPPLFYWLDMAAMSLLGTSAFTARFASLLGAWLLGASLYFTLRRWHGARAATITLGVLATCPFFFIAAQYANHDMLVAGLITAALLALARALDEPPTVRLGWLVAGWAACALAVLAKGLIGIVLPALVIGPWLLAQGRWRQMFKLLHPLGVLAFVLVAAPWFLVMQSRYPSFFDYFFVEQHFRRFAQSTFNNVHPFWFFMVVLPALTLPLSAWAPQAAQRAWAQRDARLGLLVWWVVAVVGFFSLPSSKLVGYVLPALAPWCTLLAWPLLQGRGRAWPWVMGLSAVVCVAIVAVFAWQAPKSNRGAALALAAQIGAGDRVVMVDELFYDLPFDARLTSPVIVASDWADPLLPTRDNWRKELFDAARFNPELGRALLRPLDQLDALLRGSGTVWFIVDPEIAQRVAALAGVRRAFADSRTELWRAPMRACP
jgi:4-amino-4-deoxy-L-arabinose transferase-like glycosyltransferase